ncbi:MAG: thioredoxin [Lawsonibacter sp.]|nr:thioredoxin [Lawsonibacter sp.]
MALVHFSQEGFDKAVSSGALVAVDFWAAWCGPCQMLGPVIDKLAQEYEGRAVVGKVDVDQEQELAIRHGVMSIPTIIFFKDGQELERRVGIAPGVDPFQDLSGVLDRNM